MRNSNDPFAGQIRANIGFAGFLLLAATMLTIPIFLFVIGTGRDSAFLIDGAGALFGIDLALLLWLREQWKMAPVRVRVRANRPRARL